MSIVYFPNYSMQYSLLLRVYCVISRLFNAILTLTPCLLCTFQTIQCNIHSYSVCFVYFHYYSMQYSLLLHLYCVLSILHAILTLKKMLLTNFAIKLKGCGKCENILVLTDPGWTELTVTPVTTEYRCTDGKTKYTSNRKGLTDGFK